MTAGLSSLADNPQGTDDYLRPLFDHAAAIIPASQLADTPVYVLATAGLRLLSESQSAAILQAACSYIRNGTPFTIKSCEEQVRIISGEEEGVYGWVAVNYLLDGFDAHGLADKGTTRHSSTYGFLDMGGASTQIAFEPSTDARKEHADNLLSVNLRLLDGMDVHHPVFVTTWLGYGTNQARERYVDASISDYISEHGQGLSAAVHDSSGESPLVVVDDPCLPKDLLLAESRHRGYASRGTGDFSACIKKSAPLLNAEQDCKDFPCLMGVHVPPIDFQVNHFIGISEYWYSTQDIWKLGGVYDFPTFEKSALQFCSQSWGDLIQAHSEGGSSPPDVHRLEMQCFKAAWIVNVLHEGIGIPRLSVDKGGEGGKSNGTKEAIEAAEQKGFLSPPSFQSVNEINNVAVSWTLGRMVLEATDSIPKSSKSVSHAHDEDAGTPVFEWKTGHHTAAWRQKLGSYYRSAGTTERSLAAVLMCLVLVALLYFTCVRRRTSSYSMPSSKMQRDDYGMLAMEEGGPSSPGTSSPRKTSDPISRTLLSLRWQATRIISSFRSPASRMSLPTRRNSSAIVPLSSLAPDNSRNQYKLRHSASSPNLSKRGPDSARSGFISDRNSKFEPGAGMHVDMPPGMSKLQEGNPPPLTPPARSSSPGWALRMTPASTPSQVVRSQSARAIHRSNTSASDSDGYLSIPLGISSTAPNVGAHAWEAVSSNVSDTSAKTPDDENLAFRSRQSSYTNLSNLARNRGGHSRQVSTDVH